MKIQNACSTLGQRAKPVVITRGLQSPGDGDGVQVVLSVLIRHAASHEAARGS